MIEYSEFSDKFIDKFNIEDFKDAMKKEDVSNEMILYPIFYRTMVLRRLSDFNNIRNASDLVEYPKASVIHLLDDNFLMNKQLVFVPDTQSWSMTRNPYFKFMYHVTAPITNGVITDYERFVLPQVGVIPTLMNYRKKNIHFMRIVDSIDRFPIESRSNVQCLINYNSLYRARIFGQLRNVRRFYYVFSQLVNQLALMPNRMHFIPIPVGTTQFNRSMFLRSFKEYTKPTIRFPQDPWYLFCMHFLGFLHGDPTPSVFEHIPESMWDKVHFVLYSKQKMLIVNLKTIKQFNGKNDIIMIRFIKQLNELALSGYVNAVSDMGDSAMKMDTVIDESLPDISQVTEETPFEQTQQGMLLSTKQKKQQQIIAQPQEPVKGLTTIQKTPVAVIPVVKEPAIAKPAAPVKQETEKPIAVPETKKPQQPVKAAIVKQVKPVVSIADTQAKVKAQMDEMDSATNLKFQGITIDEKWLQVEGQTEDTTANTPQFTKPIQKQAQQEFNKSTVTDIDQKAKQLIEQQTNLTKAQKDHAEKIAVAYKTIKVGKESVEQILQSVPDDSVNSNNLEFLADQVQDSSMLSSVVDSFEKDYMKKMFKRDLISQLVSFNRVGMFLKDLKTQDASDSMNNATLYIATYEDINHKEHKIRFVLPDIDDHGYCKVNGVTKVLKKQRVPNPICKVSATRVTLNSDYNKYLVQRNTTVAHSFIYYIERIFKATQPGTVITTLGSNDYSNKFLPYEFSTIAKKYSKIVINPKTDNEWILLFEYGKWFEYLKQNHSITLQKLQDIRDYQNDSKSVFFGINKSKYAMFIAQTGQVTAIDLQDGHVAGHTSMLDFLCGICDVTITGLSEWTDFKLLNKQVPTIFALCYRFGLTHMLNYTNAKYLLYEKGQRFMRKASDTVIKFADKTLVIPRVPLVVSMLFAGLNNYDLSKINMEQMDSKDIYFDLIQSKGISIHNLKGIDNFFDYFVDPITADVLHQMGEPTNPKDLLIRATQLLTTENHKPAAASTNFRFRSYERINSAVYKVLSRAHATFKHKALGATNKFSIADYEIKQLITEDQLMQNVDTINPINDIKYKTQYSHGGFGGRQSTDTFMVDDRQYPDDGVGIISEATVDSGKTAYLGALSSDPTIVNMRGMTITEDIKKLKPGQVLSCTSILYPGATTNDGKRANLYYMSCLQETVS